MSDVKNLWAQHWSDQECTVGGGTRTIAPTEFAIVLDMVSANVRAVAPMSWADDDHHMTQTGEALMVAIASRLMSHDIAWCEEQVRRLSRDIAERRSKVQ